MEIDPWLARATARRPEAVALETPEERLTYRELLMAATRGAARLVSRGAAPGDRVAITLPAGRAFVVALTIAAYLIALGAPQSIFDLAVQYAFSGYAALSPLLVAALFWKRSTKWGALAVTLWVAAAVLYTARVPGALAWFGLLPVVPMTLTSVLLMIVVSIATPAPSPKTLARYGW